jgi:histidinol-phosphate aminotransferase
VNSPAAISWLDLAAAELPEPLPAAVEAVAHQSALIQRYPATTADDHVEALADRHDVSRRTVMVGAGSSGVLVRLLSLLHTGPAAPGRRAGRREVVFAEPGFTAFPLIIRLSGGVPVPVPLAGDGSYDLAAMHAAVGPATSAVIIANPHNPTGVVTDPLVVREFGRQLPKPVTLVLDEAYGEFEPRLADGAGDRARWNGRTVLTRTFSKAYGLAGLRVGYGLVSEELAERAAAAVLPYEINSAAVVAALASLRAPVQLREQVDRVRAARERLRLGLADLGVGCPASGANFVWLPLREESAEFARHCGAYGLRVQVFPAQGVRVTAGADDAISRLLAAARSWARHGRGLPLTSAPRSGRASP